LLAELLLVGVGHGFDQASDVCRDLTRLVRSFRPQIVCVEVPPPRPFLELAKEHRDSLSGPAGPGHVTPSSRSVPDSLSRQGAEHLARGEYVEAVSCLRRALMADPQHADALAQMALALGLCRGSALEHVIVPLQDELGYRVVPIGGTRASHFDARAKAREALAASAGLRSSWETYSAFCNVIWGRLLPRYQSLEGMNSETSHALHEAAHEAIPALFGDDALDLCWAEQNRLACESIRTVVQENPGARVLVVYGCEHLYALLAWAAELANAHLVPLEDVEAQR